MAILGSRNGGGGVGRLLSWLLIAFTENGIDYEQIHPAADGGVNYECVLGCELQILKEAGLA